MRLLVYSESGQILREYKGCQNTLQLKMIEIFCSGATWELLPDEPVKVEVTQQEIDQVFHSYKWRG